MNNKKRFLIFTAIFLVGLYLIFHFTNFSRLFGPKLSDYSFFSPDEKSKMPLEKTKLKCPFDLKWGMSKSEVISFVDGEYTSSYNWILVKNKTINNIPNTEIYFEFVNDSLILIDFGFGNPSEEDFRLIEKDLEYLYGYAEVNLHIERSFLHPDRKSSQNSFRNFSKGQISHWFNFDERYSKEYHHILEYSIY